MLGHSTKYDTAFFQSIKKRENVLGLIIRRLVLHFGTKRKEMLNLAAVIKKCLIPVVGASVNSGEHQQGRSYDLK